MSFLVTKVVTKTFHGSFPLASGQVHKSLLFACKNPTQQTKSLSVSHNERLAIECFATLPALVAEAGIVPRMVFGVCFPRESEILGKNNPSK